MREVNFMNLTKHPVVIFNPSTMKEQELVVPPSGIEARVDSQLVHLDRVKEAATKLEIPVVSFENHYVYDLPPESPGKIYIVSKEVRLALPHRLDLASPDCSSSRCEYEGGKLRSVPGLVMNKGEK